MGLFSYLRGDDIAQKALTATPAVLETLNSRMVNPTLVPRPGYNQRVDSVYVEAQNATYGWMYLYQPSVRRVIDYIARNISQLGLKVFERVDDDERKHRGDHPAAELLRRPNPWTPGSQFIFEFVVDFLIYDNAYALKLRTPRTNKLETLVRIDPPMVGLSGRSYFTVDAYRIFRKDGSWEDYGPADVIHWRGFEPSDPRRGASKLETLKESLAADLASRQAVTEQFKAGLTAPGYIQRPLEAPGLTTEAHERLTQDMSNRFAKRQEIPVLEEGMTYMKGNITPEDAQYLQARDRTVEEVCAQYGFPMVPPRSEEERLQVYADVFPPYTDNLSAFLDLHILQNEFLADDLYFEFGREKVLDELYKTLTSASGRPVLLTDEARAKIDLPPVPTGDELVTPGNVSVGGKPSTGVMPIQDPNKPPQDGSHRTEDEPVPAGKNGHKKVPLVPRRRRAFERRDRWAKEYEEVLKRHFERQRRDLKKKAANAESWNRELARDLNEVYFRHFTAEGSHAARRTASIFDASYGQNWLRTKAQGTAEDINRVTKEQAEEGDLAEVLGMAVATRAAAAAKSMASDVAGFAVKVAEEQAEGSYMVTIDGGECEICAPFQGAWPAKDVPGWPGYHANCQCVADLS